MRHALLTLTTMLAVHGAQAQQLAQANTAPKDEKETEALFHAGEQAYNAGGYEKAISLFTQVLDRDPENLNAYLQRGFCHSLQREYDAAVTDFTSVIQRKNDHLWAYTSRGSAYSRLGKHDLAMRDFNQVLTIDPKNQEAYNNRGWCKKAMGDVEGGCSDWKTSKKMGNAEAKIILTNNHCK